MLIGDTSRFAIESRMRLAYRERSMLGEGRFGFHVAGKKFGLIDHKETALACALDLIKERLASRGNHLAPFAVTHTAAEIAVGVMGAIYELDTESNTYCGLSCQAFKEAVSLIAPGSADEAFDDGSRILHFDVPGGVRVIAYRPLRGAYRHDPSTLAECVVPSQEFYGILEKWIADFEDEWQAAPKLEHHEYYDP